jgi:pimeloyl-ACP methyl ester carboxylesterase
MLEREGSTIAFEAMDSASPDAADGPALVLLHSFGTSRRSLHALSERLLGAGVHARALLMDLRGHGETQTQTQTPGDGAFTYAAMRGDLLALIEAECPRGADLVGHSMGGQVALMAAIARPACCRSLVTIGAGPCREITTEAERKSWERAAGFFEKAPGDGLAKALANAAPADTEAFPELEPEKLYAGARGRDLARVIREGFFEIETNDEACAGLETPALVLAGERDEGWLEPSRKLATLMSNAQLAVVPDGGHLVHVECADACTREIAAFWGALSG